MKGTHMLNVKYMDIKEFRAMGLLQEVNRLFFHPLGLALEVTAADDGSETLTGVWDYRDDDEGMLFSDDLIDRTQIGRVKTFMAEQHAKRYRTIGYVIQEPPLPE